ncbi:hypothetical protein [Nannocystis pusilla]|uniref:Uncharacterized protein n=1 Tax=Nannocystis pusilla TaxID=889268 RepID=A0ABS7TM98_9BACT|nr:hypothetical protein [Nannocystis pusilla]MBZ5709262.1 hypothetical protein [Nannocystis pusilla]
MRGPSFRAIDLALQMCIKPGRILSTVRDAVLHRRRCDARAPARRRL